MFCSEEFIQDLGVALISFAHYVSIDISRCADLIMSKSSGYRYRVDPCKDQSACDAVTESVGVQVGHALKDFRSVPNQQVCCTGMKYSAIMVLE